MISLSEHTDHILLLISLQMCAICLNGNWARALGQISTNPWSPLTKALRFDLSVCCTWSCWEWLFALSKITKFAAAKAPTQTKEFSFHELVSALLLNHFFDFFHDPAPVPVLSLPATSPAVLLSCLHSYLLIWTWWCGSGIWVINHPKT